MLANDNPFTGSNHIQEFTYPYSDSGIAKIIWVIESNEKFGNEFMNVKRTFEISIKKLTETI